MSSHARSPTVHSMPPSASKSSRSGLSTSLTLAATSLGYGVVQLDVTIVNTAVISIGSSLGGTIGEAAQFGASLWLWGVVVRTVLVWHVTWCGNSFPHLFGYRNYETNDNSRNNALVAILTSGEGWHNNHHADPNSASNQRHWWEIDLTYLLLRLLVLLGLAWDVQLPKCTIPPSAGPASGSARILR